MADKELRLVLVTPETTLLDAPVRSLSFPLFDGQIGVLPGRAPMVGRLGYGELIIRDESGQRSYFIDGGFVQIKGSTVSLLTDRAIPSDEVDSDDAENQFRDAMEVAARNDEEIETKQRNIARARSLKAVAGKPR